MKHTTTLLYRLLLAIVTLNVLVACGSGLSEETMEVGSSGTNVAETSSPAETATPFAIIEFVESFAPTPDTSIPQNTATPGISGVLNIRPDTVSCNNRQGNSQTRFDTTTLVCLRWKEGGFGVNNIEITIEVLLGERRLNSTSFTAQGNGITRVSQVTLNTRGNYTAVFSYGSIQQPVSWTVE
jgi:hypothetical protein